MINKIMDKLSIANGQRIGQLTIIERESNGWAVRCDLGHEYTSKKVGAGDCTKCRGWIPPGTRFGKLVVVGEGPKRDARGGRTYNCLCDCGQFHNARGGNLRDGFTQSCGCGRRGKREKKERPEIATLYRVWTNLRARCSNPNAPQYPRYGGRGIECRLGTYETFRAWAEANGYQQGLSLDRVDNDGHYEYGNLRWATAREQSRNTSRTVLNPDKVRWIRAHRGQMTINEMCQVLGASRGAVTGVLYKQNWKDVV